MWTKLIIGVWIVLLSISYIQHILPASNWLEVNSVYVYNAVLGETPVMEVDRDIKQSFTGVWVADVEKLNDNGRFVIFCSSTGKANYDLDNDLPDPLTLDWWTYPTDCTPVEPGKYRIVTVWTLNLDGAIKQVKASSNLFTVSEYQRPFEEVQKPLF